MQSVMGVIVRFLVDGSLTLSRVVDHVTPKSLMLLPLLLRVSEAIFYLSLSAFLLSL